MMELYESDLLVKVARLSGQFRKFTAMLRNWDTEIFGKNYFIYLI